MPSESVDIGGSTENSSFHGLGSEKRLDPEVAPNADVDMEEPEVDEVVVDTEFFTQGDLSNSTHVTSEHEASPGRSGGSHTDRESLAQYTQTADSFWDRIPVLSGLRQNVFPAVYRFFNPKFYDEVIFKLNKDKASISSLTPFVLGARGSIPEGDLVGLCFCLVPASQLTVT